MSHQQTNYALPSIAAAYGLAFVPNYYNVLRMMAATGGKWSFAMYVPPPTHDLFVLVHISKTNHHSNPSPGREQTWIP